MKKETSIQKLAENFINNKSEKTFKYLFERLRPGLLNHCYLILKENDLAEDAFLSAMAKVYFKIDQYQQDKGNFSTWCYNIGKNESLLIIKERKKYYSHNDTEMEFISAKNEIGDIGGYYVMEDDSTNSFFNDENKFEMIYEAVLEEIRDLPDLYRDIMIDRELHKMKYKDIAEKYDMKKRSVATRIRRARNKITKKIEENPKM
jgi:RNA polymerase sigma-70 factor (ECF subfamily)